MGRAQRLKLKEPKGRTSSQVYMNTRSAARAAKTKSSGKKRSSSIQEDQEFLSSTTNLPSHSWLDSFDIETESESLDDDYILSFESQNEEDVDEVALQQSDDEVSGGENTSRRRINGDCDDADNEPMLLEREYEYSEVEHQNTVMDDEYSCDRFYNLFHRLPSYGAPTPPRRNLGRIKRRKTEVVDTAADQVSSDSFPVEEEDDSDKVHGFQEPTKGVIFLVMKVPSKITIYGKILIRSLSGTVDVYGFDVSSDNPKFYPLYSAKDVLSLQIKATRCEWRCTSHVESVKKILAEYCCQENLTGILKAWDFSSVVVMLKQFTFTSAVDFVEQYYKTILSPSRGHEDELYMHRMRGFTLSFREEGVLKVPRNYMSVAEAVLKEIEQRGKNKEFSHSGTPSCIMVYGKKGYGKSTLQRYLINKVLSVHPRVVFLDCDPGQTEFTPPACLSLTEVTDPLLGPPFTHQKKPDKLIFYGDIAIESTHFMIECIRELYSYYEEHFKGVPLFVNTFGWIKGLGKECLDAIETITRPTFVIHVQQTINEENLHRSPSPDLTFSDRISINLSSARLANMKCELAANRRELAMLAYLGQCQPYYEAPKPLNAFIPYKVKASDIVIHCIHYDIDPPYRMQAINGCFVAMCCLDDDNILVCKECSWPKKIKDRENYGKCVGFAFVRAIDEVEGIVYIVTPEPPEVLASVNALLKGNVHTPSVLFKQQGIFDRTIPYTRRLIKTRTDISKPISVQKWQFQKQRSPSPS